MKILQYLFDLFWKIYSLREFYTLALTVCFGLISAEDEPDAEILKRLVFIRDNTHAKLQIPLSVAELIILTNYSRKIGNMVEFKDNDGQTKDYPLWMVVRYTKESYFELAQFVVKIAKKYSLDIPMKPSTGTIEIPTAAPPEFADVPVRPQLPAAPSVSLDEIELPDIADDAELGSGV